MYNPKRGDQVLVSPHISGPAAGRSGCASGMRRDGHCEILDRHPDLPGAQLLGWFEPDDLFPLVNGTVPRVGAAPPECHLDCAQQAIELARREWKAGKLGSMAESVAMILAHSLAAAIVAGAPIAATEARYEQLCEFMPAGYMPTSDEGGGL